MKDLRSIIRSIVTLTAFAGCISLVLLPSIRADAWDKKTSLKVNEPIQLPSCCSPGHTVILQPGEYVMVLVDSLSDRHIVRVFDKDQQHVITTILAIPNYRLRPTGKTVFEYWEVPLGQPKALRAWFYPGDNFGQEFAYPKQTAVQIASYVKAPVPAIELETVGVEDLKSAPLVIVDESGKTSALVVATPAPVAETAPAEEPAVQTAERQTPTAAELPHTASAMPLLGLIGFLSLAAFVVMGMRSRYTANG